MTDNPEIPAHCNGPPQQNASLRALTAARQVRQFSADAKTRQTAGTRAPDGTKGKAAGQAAALFVVSTRAVELAVLVLERGIPELAQAIEKGKIRVTAAAKVARLPADAQRKVVADVVAGRPLAGVLAAIQQSAGSMPTAGPTTANTPGAVPSSPPATSPSSAVTSRKCNMCEMAQALPDERFCDNCHRILMCTDNSYAAKFYARRAQR